MNNIFFILTQSTSTSQTISLFYIHVSNAMKMSKDMLLITTGDLNIKAEVTGANDPRWLLTCVSHASPT